MAERTTAGMIISMLSDRGGFDDWWGNIDIDTQLEILSEMNKIIEEKCTQQGYLKAQKNYGNKRAEHGI